MCPCKMQMIYILYTFCEQTLADSLHFYVFLVQVASAHGVRFFTVLMLDGR